MNASASRYEGNLLQLFLLLASGLGQLEERLVVALELDELELGGSELLYVRLKDLAPVLLGCVLDPGRSVLRYGYKLALSNEVVKLLGALLPEDDVANAAVSDLECSVPGLCTAESPNLFTLLVDQSKISLFPAFSCHYNHSLSK